METVHIRVPALTLTQPIGEFYLGVIEAADLYSICFSDVRRMVNRQLDEYIGIQRELSESRVREIRQYVQNLDASFPTGIILSLRSGMVEYDETQKVLSIVKRGDVATVIDGQHRIEGLKEFSGRFQLPIVCFVDLDVEDQAMMFATINLKQTKVNKSLAYDLFEFSKARSPQRTCHDVAKVLNSSEKSPFYHRIKILGQAMEGRKETLTQAAIVERLMDMISPNPMLDRDLLRRGNKVDILCLKYEAKKHVLRRNFVAGKDLEILESVSNFFTSVKECWPVAWDDTSRGAMLSKTNGFFGFAELFRTAWVEEKIEEVMDIQVARDVVGRVQLEDSDFNTDRFVPGSGGASELSRVLKVQAGYGPQA